MGLRSGLRKIGGALQALAGGLLDGEWHRVESSWVAAARYDPGKRILYVRTKQGREYPWVHEIDRDEARGFFVSWSKGAWIWANAPPRSGKVHTGRRRRERKR